jgi:hypothetical protein
MVKDNGKTRWLGLETWPIPPFLVCRASRLGRQLTLELGDERSASRHGAAPRREHHASVCFVSDSSGAVHVSDWTITMRRSFELAEP